MPQYRNSCKTRSISLASLGIITLPPLRYTSIIYSNKRPFRSKKYSSCSCSMYRTIILVEHISEQCIWYALQHTFQCLITHANVESNKLIFCSIHITHFLSTIFFNIFFLLFLTCGIRIQSHSEQRQRRPVQRLPLQVRQACAECTGTPRRSNWSPPRSHSTFLSERAPRWSLESQRCTLCGSDQ